MTQHSQTLILQGSCCLPPKIPGARSPTFNYMYASRSL